VKNIDAPNSMILLLKKETLRRKRHERYAQVAKSFFAAKRQ
jgi:hypothetical protein